MPQSIKKPTVETRCSGCDKLLATPEGIKCPRCKKVHTYEECFAQELKPDQYQVVFLWAPDGSHSSSIIIRKEIWLNIGTRQGVPKGVVHYPVFFVYNYLDPSKAFAPDVGCRVNEEPILSFQEALKLARQQEAEVRTSGAWVEIEEIKEPALQKPKDGIWDFRGLERLSQTGRISFDDLYATLSSYSNGWAILPQVVFGIVQKTDFAFGQRSLLRDIAKRGAEHTDGKSCDEWRQLVRYLS